jgi:hypothetical protein
VETILHSVVSACFGLTDGKIIVYLAARAMQRYAPARNNSMVVASSLSPLGCLDRRLHAQRSRDIGGPWAVKDLKTGALRSVAADATAVRIGAYCLRLCAVDGFAGQHVQADVPLRPCGRTRDRDL